jgi:hypothetical protein
MKWETFDSIVGGMKILKLYILGNSTTHTNTPLYYIYRYSTLHFSVYLLKSTSTDANRTIA